MLFAWRSDEGVHAAWVGYLFLPKMGRYAVYQYRNRRNYLITYTSIYVKVKCDFLGKQYAA